MEYEKQIIILAFKEFSISVELFVFLPKNPFISQYLLDHE